MPYPLPFAILHLRRRNVGIEAEPFELPSSEGTGNPAGLTESTALAQSKVVHAVSVYSVTEWENQLTDHDNKIGYLSSFAVLSAKQQQGKFPGGSHCECLLRA